MRMTLDLGRPDTWCWSFTIGLDELDDRLTSFMEKEPHTRVVEQQAECLVKRGFQPPELRNFINAVCKWGGYSGIAARVLDKNTESELNDSFRFAHSWANAGDDLAAIESLLKLKDIGASFASKHLKFLAPENAVVLDSIISKRLGYEPTPEGYQAFLNDCRRILERAIACKLPYHGWGREWRVSDIEMAIFEKLAPRRKGVVCSQ
jgi:hypothetical protein